MAPKPKKDDLIIGENRWITFVQHDWRNAKRVDVDDILDPLFPLFDRLESDCIAECCGLDAFCFLPEKIAAASSGFDLNEVQEWLTIAIGEIERIPDDVLVSRRLNNAIDRGTLIELLQHIHHSLSESKTN